MEILAYSVIAFALVRLAVSLTNLLFLQRFPEDSLQPDELVSVLIPARNEEKNLGKLLNDLKALPLASLEIWVYNDQSTDRTEEIVKEAQKTDARIRLLNSNGLPDGWTGKNHACYSLASKANGKYLLFLDADVRLSGNVISQSISMLKSHQLALLSIFPQQIMRTKGEELTVPVMNDVLVTLLPLILVRALSFPSLAAANGQFMLFDADSYKKWQPHQKLRSRRVEDIEIARYMKQNSEKMACLTGTTNIRCRMYSGYSEAVNGLSRSVLMFFGNSALLGILFWLMTTFGWVLVALQTSWMVFIIYLLIVTATRIIVSKVSRQGILENLLWGFVQKINLGIMIGKALRNRSKKQVEWKGRAVSSS